MRVVEFQVIKYGPLSGARYTLNPGLNLLYGRNEEGKTLTIEALIKMLLRRRANIYRDAITRVEDDPKGFVVLEYDDQVHTLPDEGSIEDITSLKPEDCRNILIVRNSDLSIAMEGSESNQGVFFQELTDRLMGVRTGLIEQVKKKVLELAKLTPKGELLNRGEEKLRDRYKRAKNLLEKVEKLRQEDELVEMKETEQRLRELTMRLKEIDDELRALEAARRVQAGEELLRALNDIQTAEQKLERLTDFSDEKYQRWRDAENDLGKLEKQILQLEKDIKELGKELGKHERELKKIERRKEELGQQKEKIDKEIKPAINELKEKENELAVQQENSEYWREKQKTITLFLALSLISVLIVPTWSAILLIMVFGGIFVYSLYLGHRESLLRSRLQDMFVRQIHALEEAGINTAKIDDLCSLIRTLNHFEVEYNRVVDEYNQLNTKLAGLREKHKAKLEQLEQLQKEHGKNIEIVQDIQGKSGVKDLQEYKKMLGEKASAEREREKAEDKLQSILGQYAEERLAKGKKGSDIRKLAEEVAKELIEYADVARGMKYSEKLIKKLQNEKEQIEQEIKSHKETTDSLKSTLQDIESEVNRVLPGDREERIFCQTIEDLGAVEDILKRFINSVDKMKRHGTIVYKLFDEVGREELEKVSELFGDKSSVSKYFSEITEGMYDSVRYDSVQGQIQVRMSMDGKWLPADKLSGGAYDQLYFAVRLSLAERLLGREKGFFILDDPFIKSDPERLRKQIKMLLKFAREGWQIIYFSAKGEIHDMITSLSKNKNVKIHEFHDLKI